MLSKDIVKKDYEKLKRLCIKYYKIKDYEKTLDYAKTLAYFMYNYNLFYKDEEIEELLQEMSIKLFKKQMVNKKEKTIFFFDYFALDGRGLSLIYLRALIELKYKIVFVTYEKNNNSSMKRIKELLETYENSSIYFIDDTATSLEQSKHILDIIYEECPEKIMLHTAPWDVEALLPLYSLNGICERFMINITDHAFWLGTKAIDYSIEFRSYGWNISKRYRNIPQDNIMIIPYYPANTSKEFKGFPFELHENEKLILSGGSLYKIRGSSEFYNIVQELLKKPNVKFLFLGNGDSTEFKQFISKNHLEEKCFLLSERDDLDEVMKRCHFYLSTYPLIGGLMAQYAVANHKIPLTLAEKNDYFNKVEDLMVNCETTFTYHSKEELLEEAERLLNDKAYYEKRCNETDNLLWNPSEFAKCVEEALYYHSSSTKPVKMDIDIVAFSDVYLKQSNYFKHCSILYFTKNKKIICVFMCRFICGFMLMLKRRFSRLICHFSSKKM